MLVALYVGDHSKDTFTVRLGWALTRLAQKGKFGHVTHVEAILRRYDDGAVDIASSSVRDGGVRRKNRVWLNPASWLIADVPTWDEVRAALWFADHDGAPYDWRGAVATVLPGHPADGEWFCNASIGASVGMCEPKCFDPAQFAAVCFAFGRNFTQEFFTPKE